MLTNTLKAYTTSGEPINGAGRSSPGLMMSVRALLWAAHQKAGSGNGRAVLWALADRANAQGICWPSQDTIAADAELSERTVLDKLQDLEQRNLIVRERQQHKKGGRSSDRIRLSIPANFAVKGGKIIGGLPANSASNLPAKTAANQTGNSESLPANIAGGLTAKTAILTREICGVTYKENLNPYAPLDAETPKRSKRRGLGGKEPVDVRMQFVRSDDKLFARFCLEVDHDAADLVSVQGAQGWHFPLEMVTRILRDLSGRSV